MKNLLQQRPNSNCSFKGFVRQNNVSFRSWKAPVFSVLCKESVFLKSQMMYSNDNKMFNFSRYTVCGAFCALEQTVPRLLPGSYFSPKGCFGFVSGHCM